MAEIIKCFGCGETLQDIDEKKPGYVPSKILNEKKEVLCQRCFRLQHYSTNSEFENLLDEDYIKILKNLTKSNALIVYVLDIFNFEDSLIDNLSKYVKDKPLLVLINKKDILPSSVKDNKIIEWVKYRLNELKISNIQYIVLSSGQTNYNIDTIFKKINQYRNKKDVYIIGNTNVGKSTFINSLLKNYTNVTSHFITTSHFPGTTLNVIKIPLDDNSFIFDTPGIIKHDLMWSIVEPKLLKHILPQKEIKPLTFQLKSRQSLLLGGLAIFDFVEGDSTNFTTYFSNFVQVRRTKLERSNSTFNSLLKNKHIRPYTQKIKSIDDLTTYEIEISDDQKIDIVISGYGWISFKGKLQKIKLRIPKGVSYKIRKALI